MRYGLLQASCIPPAGQRDLRDLTRYRTQLVQERGREVKRGPGVWERANITLAARRGKKRAILAVAYAIVVSAFHMRSRNEPYRELGANYVDEHRRHQLVDRLARRIERLGYQVSLQPVTAA